MCHALAIRAAGSDTSRCAGVSGVAARACCDTLCVGISLFHGPLGSQHKEACSSTGWWVAIVSVPLQKGFGRGVVFCLDMLDGLHMHCVPMGGLPGLGSGQGALGSSRRDHTWCGHVSAIGEASKHVHASQHGSFCHDRRNGLLSQPKAVAAAHLHGRGVETFPGVWRGGRFRQGLILVHLNPGSGSTSSHVAMARWCARLCPDTPGVSRRRGTPVVVCPGSDTGPVLWLV